MISNLYYLSVSNGLEGIKIDYQIVKDFSEKYEFESIDTLALIQNIAYEVAKRKDG